MKDEKIKHILTLTRRFRGVSLVDVRHKGTGERIHSMSEFENNKRTPSGKMILDIAEDLDVHPDILFYSFGILPKYESDIIKLDPFFYLEKIKYLCNNHKSRYGNRDIDLNKLNDLRMFDYINKRKREYERNFHKGNTN